MAASRSLLLVLVAYHPSQQEVDQLKINLRTLSPEVGYSVVVNDHQPGEPVDQLLGDADHWLVNTENLGYGRAVNRLVRSLEVLPAYLGILNTDLSWDQNTFSLLLGWLQVHPDVVLAVPQIVDERGVVQKLCKQNPTVLGLLSRRFIPRWCKPNWLRRYDNWYVMHSQNYQQVFEAPYLSGCCMLTHSESFQNVGGFDERYFLYLEDADLTRKLVSLGRCIHLPQASIVHAWGRGNYGSWYLTLVNLHSAWLYFCKWGWALW